MRWSKCLANLHTSAIDRLVFLGPGKALANLARKDETASEVLSVATEDDMQSYQRKLKLEREAEGSE